jgi:mannose-6-phosphate isomerase-like protein (cupin superfamily)
LKDGCECPYCNPNYHVSISWGQTKTIERPWGDEILIASTPQYTGKLLKRYGDEPYHRAGLQFHPDRSESSYLLSGSAWLYWVDALGVLRKRLLQAGDSVFIPEGAIHSFETVRDSVVVETSVPGWAPAVRVEERYDISTAIES